MDGVALIKSEPGLTLPSDDEDLDAELEHLQKLRDQITNQSACGEKLDLDGEQPLVEPGKTADNMDEMCDEDLQMLFVFHVPKQEDTAPTDIDEDEAQPAQPAEDVLDSQEEQAHQAMEKLAIYGPWRAVPIYLGESDGNLLGGDVGDATAAVDSPTSADPYLTLQDQEFSPGTQDMIDHVGSLGDVSNRALPTEPSSGSQGTDKANHHEPSMGPQAIVDKANPNEPTDNANGISNPISRQNAMKRLYRLFKQRADGSYAVSEDLIKQWRDESGREYLLSEFQKAGYNKDLMVAKCTKRIKEKISEQDMWVDGAFASEEDMKTELNFSENRIKAVKAECAKHKGWIRRDRSEKHIQLFWVEKNMCGKMLKKRRSVLLDEDETDEEFDDHEDDFEMNAWTLSAQDKGADAVTQREKSEADREAAWSKTLKTVSWPEMDDDALPSTYCGKVMNCLGKWQLKISDMAKSFDQFSELDECLEQLKQQCLELSKTLNAAGDKLADTNKKVVLGGLEPVQQDELKMEFKSVRNTCIEALNLHSRAQPYLAHTRKLLRKRKAEEGQETLHKSVKQEPTRK